MLSIGGFCWGVVFPLSPPPPLCWLQQDWVLPVFTSDILIADFRKYFIPFLNLVFGFLVFVLLEKEDCVDHFCLLKTLSSPFSCLSLLRVSSLLETVPSQAPYLSSIPLLARSKFVFHGVPCLTLFMVILSDFISLYGFNLKVDSRFPIQCLSYFWLSTEWHQQDIPSSASKEESLILPSFPTHLLRFISDDGLTIHLISGAGNLSLLCSSFPLQFLPHLEEKETCFALKQA